MIMSIFLWSQKLLRLYVLTSLILFIFEREMNAKYFKSQEDHQIIDIFDFFAYYNSFFFEGVLERCIVEWSEKMTLCAGTCTHSSYDSCTIRLSAPLLQFRSGNELKETLLHEMIHAFLFLTNPRACLTEGGHGKEFQKIMHNINSITGLNITIYHNFKDQVDLYRKHVWRCDGPCKQKPPFYGYVKRAMNRKPQPADPWFKQHQRICGGTFLKESGPEQKLTKNAKNKRKSKEKDALGKGKTIDQYLKQMARDSNKQEKPKRLISKEQKQSQLFAKKAKSIQEYLLEIQQAEALKAYDD